MDAEHWKKIKLILEEAIEIPAASRSHYLDEVCKEGENFRGEIESLLDFDNAEADLLEQNAFSAVTQNGFSENPKTLIGTQIGNYKITGKLGAVRLRLVKASLILKIWRRLLLTEIIH